MGLDILAQEARWVAWRNELRGSKPTKVPYAPNGRKAKADDPATWGTRDEAERCAARLVNGKGGGIGIQLGDLGNYVHLAGIELDSCLGEDGTLAEWAQAILDAVPSYAEVSPSGQGLKLFFYHDQRRPTFPRRHRRSARAMGNSARCAAKTLGGHGPAVEVYLSHRYFTVTGNKWAGAADELTLVDGANLDRLAALIPPGKSANSSRGNGLDNSRSAIAFRKGVALRRVGKSFDEMCAALRADPETADWVREKGDAYGGRELRRIWDRAARPLNSSLEFSDDAWCSNLQRSMHRSCATARNGFLAILGRNSLEIRGYAQSL
jgi:putative DNA primase/helicase